MKNLWTPWRMEYVRQEKGGDGCIFETAPTAAADREGLLLYRSPLAVAFLNRYPYANGHLLIAPSRHVADLTELTGEESAAMMALLQQSVEILRRHMRPAGFNIGLNLGEVAGAGLADHLHFHVVPRWAGDHNYMTVLAEVRTIPQHIDDTFMLLLPDFQALLNSGKKGPNVAAAG